MKKLLLGYGVVLLMLTSCVAQTSGPFREIDSNTLITFQSEKKDLLLVDVRTPEEFADGKLKGSSNVNVKSDDFEKLINQFDKNKPIVVYCLAGMRSGKAMDIMKKNGFKEVYSLKGGIESWQKEGHPLVK